MSDTSLTPDLCVYCGSTDDHVPPKNIFPKPRPDLVTVRSCKSCNNGESKNDEYFRAILVMHEDAGSTRQGHESWKTVCRSLHRPRARWFSRSLARSLFELDDVTTGGIYLGTGTAIKIQPRRIDRVIERTVRGLFFEHFRRPMPFNDVVKTFSEYTFKSYPKSVQKQLGDMVTEITSQKRYQIGDDIFEYSFVNVNDHETTTAWAMRFYNSVYFIAMNVPQNYKEIATDSFLIGPSAE